MGKSLHLSKKKVTVDGGVCHHVWVGCLTDGDLLLLEPLVDVAEDDVGAGGEALLGGEGHVECDEAAVGGEQQVVEWQGRLVLEDVEGVDLLNELIRYGVSAIALDITGSHKQGIRACVALVQRDQFPDLKVRLEQFHKDHPVK